MTNKQHALAMIAVVIGWMIILAFISWSPGLFNIDELHYVIAAQRFAEQQTFTVPNGFEFFKTNALLFMHPINLRAFPNQEIMTTFIPPLWTFPASIAWSIGGITAIKIMNGFFYGLSLGLFAWIASKVGASEKYKVWNPVTGWAGLLFGIGGVYFADYAFSANSHMISLFLVLGAVAFHPLIYDQPKNDQEHLGSSRKFVTIVSLICGVLISYGIGIRLQNIFYAAVMGFSLFLISRHMIPAMIFYLLGLAGPLFLTGYINFQRFGSGNPMSYGIIVQDRLQVFLNPIENHPFVSLLVILLGVAASLFIFQILKTKYDNISEENRDQFLRITVLSVLSILLLVFFFGPLRRNFFERIAGFAIFLAPYDYFRGVDPLLSFWTGFRSSLLPTAPVLVVGFLAPFLYPKGTKLYGSRILLIGLVWVGTLFVCYLKNSGGFFMNQRYMIEAAGIALILSVDVLNCWWGNVDRKAILAGGGFSVLLIACVVFFANPGFISALPPDESSFWTSPDYWLHRVMPLLLCLILVVSVLVMRFRETAIAPKLFAFVLIPCISFPLLLHVWYHVIFVHGYREQNIEFITAMDSFVKDGDVVIVSGRERELAGFLKLDREVWVADLQRESVLDIKELIQEIEESGKRKSIIITSSVYNSFESPAQGWEVINIETIPLLRKLPEKNFVSESE